MKIFRRKKNGREVGTFYVRRKGGGRPISLALNGVPCTNASEAMKRAALALKGKWPPAAAGAAKAAARAEHVPEDDDLGPGESPKGGEAAVASGPVPSPSAPPEPDPSPESSPGGAEAGDEPDPVAAAAAAAADASGPAPGEGAIPDDEAARRERWGQEFAARFGGMAFGDGSSSISPGAIVAMVQWSVVAKAAARIGAARTPPQRLVVDPQAIAAPMQMLAMAWDEQLRRWGLSLAGVSPWMAILGGTVGLIIACNSGLQPEGAVGGGQ